MVENHCLPCSQEQAEHADAQPCNVQNSELRAHRDCVPSEENSTVKHEDDAGNLAAEVCGVADHQKPIRFLDRAADSLMTSTKLSEVAAELAPITDTFAELVVQLVELMTQKTHHHVVHCLRKLPQLDLTMRIKRN